MIRKLRFVLTLTAMMAAVGFVLTGCELEDDADADGGIGGDTTQNDTTGGDTNTQTFLEYRFVRIDDLSTQSTTPDGGADIDAVVLTKSGGQQFSADAVEDFVHGGGSGEALDPNAATGTPDAFMNWPDLTDCNVSASDGMYVSLGGVGGYIILHMEAAIEAGDGLEVFELGDCDFIDSSGNPGTARSEEVEVLVSVSSEPNSTQWVTVGRGQGPVADLTVPSLPQVPAGN